MDRELEAYIARVSEAEKEFLGVLGTVARTQIDKAMGPEITKVCKRLGEARASMEATRRQQQRFFEAATALSTKVDAATTATKEEITRARDVMAEQLALVQHDVDGAVGQHGTVTGSLEATQQEVNELRAAVDGLAVDQSSGRSVIDATLETLGETSGKLGDLASGIASLETLFSEFQRAERELHEATSERVTATATAAAERVHLAHAAITGTLDELAKHLDGTPGLLRSVRDTAVTTGETIGKLQTNLGTLLKRQSQAKDVLDTVADGVVSTQAALEGLGKDLDALKDQLAALEERAAEQEKTVAQLGQRHDANDRRTEVLVASVKEVQADMAARFDQSQEEARSAQSLARKRFRWTLGAILALNTAALVMLGFLMATRP